MTLLMGLPCLSQGEYVELGTIDAGLMENAEGDGLGVTYMNSKWTVPVPVKNNIILLGGMHHDFAFLDGKSTAHHTVIVGNKHLWNDTHSTTIAMLPRYNKDKELGGSWQVGAIGVHTISRWERFSLKGGVYYRQEEDGAFILPLAGFDWRPNDFVTVSALLPQQARVAVDFGHFRTTLNWQAQQFTVAQDGGYHKINDYMADVRVEYGVVPNFLMHVGVGHRTFKNTTMLIEETNHDLSDICLSVGATFRIVKP